MLNIRIGEWKAVQLNKSVSVVGYVSNMANHSVHGEQVTLTRVALLSDGEIEFLIPSTYAYAPDCLQPADGFWDQLQDRTALVDLALLTKDEAWFNELMESRPALQPVAQ